MTTIDIKKTATQAHTLKKLIVLTLVFTLIIVSIVTIRGFQSQEREFVDSVAEQIEQEMANNQIVLSSSGGRRTVADFQDPIIMAHGDDARLIVYKVPLSETVSISSTGLGGWRWTSTYQEIKCEGIAEYTVDLSQLSEEDFFINTEEKTLTVRIPYAVLSPINIPAEQIKFSDPERGWAAPKDIKLTPEETTQLIIQVTNTMKAKLIDDNYIALANEEAKKVVAELLTATVQSIDPEYTVIVVQ